MSDDTTTWLKKNPSINPLRRSLKASMLFHVPNSDMNASIMSNPDKGKEQGVFIPRMLQRAKMRKSKMHEFKVPEMVPKAKVKKEAAGSMIKKKVPTPNKTKKSLLPVSKTKPPSAEKPSMRGTLPRPSFMPGTSGRRTTVRRDIIKKVAELSEIKRKEAEASQLKAISGDSSVLRSILKKKRASLRRSSQISATKPKAKKVLFDGFGISDEEEKENDISLTLGDRSDFNSAIDEPTVFLNFPKGMEVEESPFEPPKSLNWSAADTETSNCDIKSIVQIWRSYQENLHSIQTERNSLENSLKSLLQHSLDFRKQYETYIENSEGMFEKLTKLGEELEGNLKKVLGESLPEVSTPKRNRRTSSEKIKMSDKSKAIKKCSERKIILKKELLKNVEGSLRTMASRGC